MLRIDCATAPVWRIAAQEENEGSILADQTELDLSPYRARTMALLRRYAHASVEVGRLPCLAGEEYFRSRVTSFAKKNFEDAVIFVTDVERALDRLDDFERHLITMGMIEEYTVSEAAQLLGCSERTAQRLLHKALDELSRILLAGGLLQRLPSTTQTVFFDEPLVHD